MAVWLVSSKPLDRESMKQFANGVGTAHQAVTMGGGSVPSQGKDDGSIDGLNIRTLDGDGLLIVHRSRVLLALTYH